MGLRRHPQRREEVLPVWASCSEDAPTEPDWVAIGVTSYVRCVPVPLAATIALVIQTRQVALGCIARAILAHRTAQPGWTVRELAELSLKHARHFFSLTSGSTQREE